MINGVGVDIVKISRIEKAYKKWGDRFIKRVFTEKEISYCSRKRNPFQHYASRFCAKEAFLKALGVGKKSGIGWKDIEVINERSGKPGLTLYNLAREMAMKKGIRSIHLSLSHDEKADIGIAFVIIEK